MAGRPLVVVVFCMVPHSGTVFVVEVVEVDFRLRLPGSPAALHGSQQQLHNSSSDSNRSVDQFGWNAMAGPASHSYVGAAPSPPSSFVPRDGSPGFPPPHPQNMGSYPPHALVNGDTVDDDDDDSNNRHSHMRAPARSNEALFDDDDIEADDDEENEDNTVSLLRWALFSALPIVAVMTAVD